MIRNRKAEVSIGNMGGTALQIGVVTVIIALVALVVGSISATNTNSVTGFGNSTAGYQTYAGLVVTNGSQGLGTFGSYIPIIVLVIIFVILLTIIIGVYAVFKGKDME